MGFVRPLKSGVIMQVTSQYEAALALLAAGAVIEQTSDAPVVYQLKSGRETAPMPGSLVQQLLVHGRICVTCRVSGRLRYVAT